MSMAIRPEAALLPIFGQLMAGAAGKEESMSEEQRESKVLRILMELMSSTANGTRLNGERSGFFQMFDTKPDEPSEPEIHENRFGVPRAREFLGEQMKAGIAGFSCLQQEGGRWMLRAEVFEIGSSVSASGCLPLRRTLLGRVQADPPQHRARWLSEHSGRFHFEGRR